MTCGAEEENVRGRRVRINIPAWLEAQFGKLVPCTVANIGEEGAQLCITPDLALPNRFTIRLTEDGKITRTCRVIWQKNDRLGVRFVSS